MNLFNSGIRRHLLVLLAIIMLPVTIHLWYAGHVQRQQTLNYAELQVEMSMRTFRDRQELLVEKSRNLLSMLSRLPQVQNIGGSECSDALAGMHSIAPEYSTMVVASPQGRINCCSLPLQAPLDVSDREWFQRVVESRQFVVGNFIISRSAGKASLPFAYPVLDDDGSLRFILGAALDLTVFDRIFADLTLPAGTRILIADHQGTLLYASEDSGQWTGRKMDSYLDVPFPFDNGKSGIEGRVEQKGYLFWLRNLTMDDGHNTLILAVGIPRQALFGRAETRQAVQTLLLLGVFLLAAALAWHFAGRLIIAPIRMLVEQTRHISTGRMETGLDTSRLSGEFRQLAEAFSAMTAQLALREAERDKAEQALRESEQRYRALFEQSPISLWEEDFSALKTHLDELAADGVNDFRAYFSTHPEQIGQCLKMIKVLHVNRQTIALYEASSEQELLGSLGKVLPRGSLSTLQEQLVAIAEGRPFSVEVENTTLGGRVMPVLVNSALPAGYERSWARVFISVFDLSDRYRIERQRQELEHQLLLAQKMETVGTLAGGIAHDFNNILSPIIGYTELSLATDDLHPEIRSQLTSVLTAARRAKEMVHQILAFSRRQESSKEPVDLVALSREALNLLRSSIPSTITLRAELSEPLPPVEGDGSRLHQVIMNLCTNAYQALKTTGGTITVGVCRPTGSPGVPLRTDRPHLLLFVEDTGPGIPRELQERIFDPFFTTKGPGEGSGMGLAVVHGIVKDHQGVIEVQSEPGRGARFEVYLPCAESERVVERKIPEGPFPTGSEHVLVIDDEESLVQMVGAILTKLGYTVSSFTSSIEALKAFRVDPQRFDLLLTDQTMPTLTGIETAREMLAIRPDLPVILYTGFSETTGPEHAARAGISRFIYKPLSTGQLAAAVREVLDRHRRA